MNDVQKAAVAQLRAQQSEFPEASTQFHAAEQLIEICQREPDSARLILEDLKNPDMSVERAERQIKKAADELHKSRGGSCVGVSGATAEKILRNFYGLPDAPSGAPKSADEPPAPLALNLADFL